ncbi:MAG TPA: CocE/NonD family hydrolase, partial [Parafilimonas sp.]|nr:CocE/NonD family hydrolase [Parafilimonas sp.]
MKKLPAFFLLLACGGAIGQDIDSVWIVNNYTKKEVYIPMRDGKKLFTAVYVPKDTTELHPILMERTPYSCAPYGENKFDPAWWTGYLKEYFKEHYIMVVQDVRGRWMSEDEFVNVRPFNPNKSGKEIDEASDTYDAIDWLVKNISHNNGKVGVHGISYPGFYSTMAAASNHPALKAVSPQAPVTNWFIGDDFHHNGVFFQMDAFDFYSALGFGFGQPHPRPTADSARSIGYPDHDNYKFFLEAGSLKNLTRYMGDTIAFWKDLMSHPNYDAWWKARDARNATKKLQPAMLWVGGEFDAEDCWGAWNSYKAAEENNPGKSFNKIVEGPWYHSQWATTDGGHLGNVQFGSNTAAYFQQHLEIPFFNYFLKGKGNTDSIAEANIFITGANKWRSFSAWPPANKEDKTLYLQPDGKLGWSESEGTSDAKYSEYTSDPNKPAPYEEDVHFNRSRTYMDADQRFAERRPDVLTFKTDTLTKDITVTGSVIADLLTSISTTDADFVVKIIDVFPEYMGFNDVDIYAVEDAPNIYPMGGYEMLVRAEIFRGRYRKSYENPEAFMPGEVEEVKFNLPDVAHTFKTGHRIMVQIQSSWFPLADRNPQQFIDIYHCDEKDFIKSDIR